MSLGLDDLSRRKKPTPRSKTKASDTPAASPPNLVLDRPNPARPWSTNGLARRGESRSEAAGKGAAISADWAERSTPGLGIEREDDSQFARFVSVCLSVEERIWRAKEQAEALLKAARAIAKTPRRP